LYGEIMRVKRNEKKGADDRRRGQKIGRMHSRSVGEWDWSKEGII
jgi:hypothetical protein